MDVAGSISMYFNNVVPSGFGWLDNNCKMEAALVQSTKLSLISQLRVALAAPEATRMLSVRWVLPSRISIRPIGDGFGDCWRGFRPKAYSRKLARPSPSKSAAGPESASLLAVVGPQ